tara:strand:- start:599 stop:781 length:183 start_codon:yes stop_codon:yes gene_type:complete
MTGFFQAPELQHHPITGIFFSTTLFIDKLGLSGSLIVKADIDDREQPEPNAQKQLQCTFV